MGHPLAVLSWIHGGLHQMIVVERELAKYSGLNPSNPQGINPYDIQYDTGPAWMFPAAFFRTSPVVVLAALTGALTAIYRWVRARSFGRLDLTLGLTLISFCMPLIQVAMQRDNFRYTAPVYGTICMLAGLGVGVILPLLFRLVIPLGRQAAWAILGFVLVVAALRDFNYASDKFLATGFQDLALRPVLGVPPLPAPAESLR